MQPLQSPNTNLPEEKITSYLPSDRAALYFERAVNLIVVSHGSSIEIERMLKEVQRALSFGVVDHAYYMFLARVYRQAGDLASAIFCYRYILRVDKEHKLARRSLLELLILRGKEYMIAAKEYNWNGKYILARACFDEALEISMENSEIWVNKAICHIHIGQLPEALECLNKVIKPNKVLPCEIYILRAKVNWGRGMLEQGNQDMRVAASINNSHPEVLGFIKRCYEKSEKLYKLALKRFSKGKTKEALECIEFALTITEEDIKLFLFKAKLFRILDDLQSAYDTILQAKQIFQTKCEESQYTMNLPHELQHEINLIFNDMALKFAQEGDYLKAILLFNKIIRDENRVDDTFMRIDYHYYVNRGDCFRALHQLSDAILDYDSALKIAPTAWEVLTRLSVALYLTATDNFNASKFREAEHDLSRAIECNPKVSGYYALRGKARLV